MAELNYPPFSAPTTMDRNRKKTRKAQTEIKKKPWWKRSQRKPKKLGDRSALPPPPGQDKMTYPGPAPYRFEEFSPFMRGREKINPLSGGGTPFLFQQLTGGMAYPPAYPPPMRPINEAPRYEKSSHQEEEKGVFSPPTPKPSRPPLSNILPMFDNPSVHKTKLEKTQSTGVNKLPKHAPPGGRRNSTPAVTTAPEVHRALNKQRPMYTSAQSTTSDITYQRMARKRRASAIRALPTLPSGSEFHSSAPSIEGEKKDSEGTNSTSPSDVMYVTPPNLTSIADKDPSMYGWSEQPHEQLQKLEEELEGESGESKEQLKKHEDEAKQLKGEEVVKKEEPEGEETKGTMAWEKEQKHEPVGKTKSDPVGKSKQKQKNLKSKSKKSKSIPNEEDKVTDFAEEFAKQLTLGDSFEDVLY